MKYYLLKYDDIIGDGFSVELWREELEPIKGMSYKSKNGWELAFYDIDQVLFIMEADILVAGTEEECERVYKKFSLGLELLK